MACRLKLVGGAATAACITAWVVLQGATNVLFGKVTDSVGIQMSSLKLTTLVDSMLKPAGDVGAAKATINDAFTAGAAVIGIAVVCGLAYAVLSAIIGSRAGGGIQKVLVVLGGMVGLMICLQIAA